MKIVPVKRHCVANKAAPKTFPKNSMLKNTQKAEYVQNLKLAGVFDRFEESLRETIRTFVYMVKVIYKG